MGDNNSNFSNNEASHCSNDSFVVPGVSDFVPLQNPDQSPPSWNKDLTKEDYNYMQRKCSVAYYSNIILNNIYFDYTSIY